MVAPVEPIEILNLIPYIWRLVMQMKLKVTVLAAIAATWGFA
jgi:hypothetical protein